MVSHLLTEGGSEIMRERMMWVEPIRDVVQATAERIGVQALFVGGLVRDAIIGRTNKDVDICVVGHPNHDIAKRMISSLPEEIRNDIVHDLRRAGDDRDLERFLSEAGGSIALSIEIFLNGGGTHPIVYTRFLTSMMNIDGMQVEFTGARRDDYGKREGGGSRSRNPIAVTPADERSDARRRDFTINALFVDLSDWKLVDPTGMGVKDINRSLIRVTRPDEPDVVFDDDPLRILRAIRFSSQLGYRIEKDTLGCIERMTRKKGRKFFSQGGFVSSERIRDEISKMLLSRDPVGAIKTMSKIGLLGIIIPEVQKFREIGHVGHKDIWDHTMIVMANAIDIPDDIRSACDEIGDDAITVTRLRIALSAMLHDIGKMVTRDYGVSTCTKCDHKVKMLNRPERRCRCGETVKFIRDSVTFHDHHKASARMARNILSRLKFENQMIDWVSEDCFLHTLDDRFLNEGTVETPMDGDTKHVPNPKIPIERLINRFASSKGEYDPKWGKVNELVRWHVLSSDASGERREIVEIVARLRARASEIQMLRKEEAESIRANRPLIGGDELRDIFGIIPGPWIGEAHRRMRDDRLENPDIHDRERAMEIARSVVHELFGL